MTILAILQRIASEYPSATKTDFSNHPLAVFMRNEAPKQLAAELSIGENDLIPKGSPGQGGWSAVPWLALVDPLVTETMQKGYYIV